MRSSPTRGSGTASNARSDDVRSVESISRIVLGDRRPFRTGVASAIRITSAKYPILCFADDVGPRGGCRRERGA
jgi:hypothetical protein